MPNSSTVTQLLEIMEIFHCALDENKEILLTFCDVSKAFDRVWHRGLLHKLEKVGISGNLLQWFKCYLSNRTQCTVVNGQKSSTSDITAGVPQGSVLGALLFIIYMNDLIEQINIPIRLYADDVTLFIAYDEDSSNFAQHNMNQALEDVTQWATSWLVKFNPEKTTTMNISRRRNPTNLLITMQGTHIEQEQSHKHLGIYLQDNAKWQSHVEAIANKARKKVDILRYLNKTLDRKSLEKLYLVFIRPTLEYGCPVWNNLPDYHCKMLEDIQLQAARAVTGLKRGTSHELIYNETKWEPLKLRRDRQSLILLHKITYKKAPQTLINLMPPHPPAPSRNPMNYQAPTTTTSTMHLNSFLPRTIRLWNNLSREAKSTKSIETFKRLITPTKLKVPEHFYTGDYKQRSRLCRMRNYNDDLNENLFSKNLSNTPMCTCGLPESMEHFLLNCTEHTLPRAEMLNSLLTINPINTKTLIGKSLHLPKDSNIKITKAVLLYIKTTKRFD